MPNTSLRAYAREFGRDAIELEPIFGFESIERSKEALVSSLSAIEGVFISSENRFPPMTFADLRLLALNFVRTEPSKNILDPPRRVIGRCTLELLLCSLFQLENFSGR